ncbi:hypothetical protein [Mycobacterium sp. AT1]|nr:hypothetical protein [Mycobacterium sp. AT1]
MSEMRAQARGREYPVTVDDGVALGDQRGQDHAQQREPGREIARPAVHR